MLASTIVAPVRMARVKSASDQVLTRVCVRLIVVEGISAPVKSAPVASTPVKEDAPNVTLRTVARRRERPPKLIPVLAEPERSAPTREE
jgi:hypothetical protein